MVVGQTKDAGFEIGVSKTVPFSVERVWELLTSREGVRLWLGEAELGTKKGDRYKTSTGVEGEIRSYHEHDRLRLTWRPADWTHDTTVQIAVTPKDETKTTVTFHQEWLASTTEREQQRVHWRAVLTKVVEALND
jgi:uncharacterized protein YndB with AHSA1/START domain